MLDDPKNLANQVREPVQKRAQPERQQFLAVLILFIVVSIIIGALYLAQATTSISTVRDIQNLSRERDRLEREIEYLRAENAGLYSLPRMMERAATLGFVTAGPNDIQYIVVEGYVFDQPAPTMTPVIITATPPFYEDNFAGWLRRQIDGIIAQFESWGEE